MKERIRKIIALLLQINENEVVDGFSKENYENWDSLVQMNLIVALEEEFGIEFNEEEALLTESFASICEMVEGKLLLRQTV
jgi:acyl carrier protein